MTLASLLVTTLMARNLAELKVQAAGTVQGDYERMGGQAIAVGNRQFLFGGFSYQDRQSHTEVASLGFDGTDVLSSLRMRFGRNHFGVVDIDGHRALVIGGYHEERGTLNFVESLDFDKSKVEPWPNLLHPVELFTTYRFGDTVAVVGGLRSQAETKCFDQIQTIDLKSRQVGLSVGRMAVSRFGHDSAFVPGISRLMIAGGKHVQTVTGADGKPHPQYTPTDSIELWDPATGQFSDGGRMTVARDRPKLIPVDDTHVLIAGGTDENSYFDSVELYDATARSSKVVAHMSVPRMALLALPFNKRGAFLMGGWVRDAEAGKAIEYIDFKTFQVSTVGHALACRAEGSVLYTGVDQFVLIGGKDSFNGRNPHDYSFKTTESFVVRH